MNSKNISKSTFIIATLLLIVFISMTNIHAINVENSTYYPSSNGTLDDQIQSIIDNAPTGSTVNFLGTKYEDLSLIINKKLNIVGHNTTIINNQNQDYIFMITPNGAGTTISGFTLINNNNGGNGISVIGANNVVIKNNQITAKNSAVYIYQSTGTTVSNNILQSSTNGLHILDSTDTTVSKNTMTKNSQYGIYNDNSVNTKISSNQISQNKDGIYTSGSAKNLKVYNNTISKNTGNGIGLDSSNNNGLSITSNNIIYNNVGVNFLRNYVDASNKQIEYNRISLNYNMNLLVKESSYNQLSVGANWYGANDKAYAGICDKAKTTLIQYDLIPYTVNGKVVSGVFLGVFHIGDKIISSLPTVDPVGAVIYQGAQPGYNDQKIYATSVNGVAMFNLTNALKNPDQYKIKSWADNQYDVLKKDLKIDTSGITGTTENNNNKGKGKGTGGNGNQQGGGNGNNKGGNNQNNQPGGKDNNGNTDSPEPDSSLGTQSTGGTTQSISAKILDVLNDRYPLKGASPYILVLTCIIIVAAICTGLLKKYGIYK